MESKSIYLCTIQVYAADIRNHGKTARSSAHNYDLLSADLKRFYDEMGIKKAALLGHSMGGRTMLNFSFKYVSCFIFVFIFIW